MPSVIADSSAIAAVAFNEPGSDAMVRRLRGCHLVAPTLLPYELASVCVKKSRLLPESADIMMANLRDALAAVADLRHVDPEDAIALALRCELSAYDAAYLWLARSLRVELVTLDAKLERAFRSHRPA